MEGNANVERLGQALQWHGQLSEALHQNHLIRVRIVGDTGTPDWLLLAINSEATRRQIRDHAKTSSGLHTINSRVVSDLIVPLPAKHEQNAISAAVGGCDTRIAAEHAVLGAARQVKSALMSVLLTGEVRVKPEQETA